MELNSSRLPITIGISALAFVAGLVVGAVVLRQQPSAGEYIVTPFASELRGSKENTPVGPNISKSESPLDHLPKKATSRPSITRSTKPAPNENIGPNHPSIGTTGPIFGVRLGQTLTSLQHTCKVQASTYHFTDPDHPGTLWSLAPPAAHIKRLLVSAYGGRVYELQVFFSDTSETNYEAVKKSLLTKYNVNDADGLMDSLLGELRFSTKMGGVLVHVLLNRDIVLVEPESLTLSYRHAALAVMVAADIQKIKSSRIDKDI